MLLLHNEVSKKIPGIPIYKNPGKERKLLKSMSKTSVYAAKSEATSIPSPPLPPVDPMTNSFRMASEDLTLPVLAATASGGGGSGSSSSSSAGVGGTAATEAAPPETVSGRSLGGAAVGGKDIDEDGDEGDREAEKLRLTAEKLKLQVGIEFIRT